ncbi:hypothetical protein HDU77_002510 [Chytriomyces hyalinus]|nr:hypothetical protein HDU77_002510 [Chytriomyces hyalinus]
MGDEVPAPPPPPETHWSDHFPSYDSWLSENAGASLDEHREAMYEHGRYLNMELKQFDGAFAIFSHLAHTDHIGGMNNVGLCMQEGEGCEKNPEEGFKWLKKSAERGFAKAQYNMGVTLSQGIGCEKDSQAAVQWYLAAVAANYKYAPTNLGLLYKNGDGVERDYSKAMEWYMKGIEAGDSAAFTNVGWMYENGCGVEKSSVKAVEYYEMAAASGDAVANYNLGVLHENGTGVPKDEAKAARFYKVAADAGDASALCNLAWMYEYGKGVPHDYDQALQYYLKSAESNHIHAMHNLGVKYADGTGVVMDEERAVHFYERAAKLKHPSSLCNLGYMYQHGHGCVQNVEKAVELYRESADLGDTVGALNTAIVYEYGRGVDIDLMMALRYYRIAAKKDSRDAIQKLTPNADFARSLHLAGVRYFSANKTTEASEHFCAAHALGHPDSLNQIELIMDSRALLPVTFASPMRYFDAPLSDCSALLSSMMAEILDLIFQWVHPTQVIQCRRLSRRFSEHFASEYFAKQNLRHFVLRKYSRAGLQHTVNLYDRMLLQGPHAFQTAYIGLHLNCSEGEIDRQNKKFVTLGKLELMPIPLAFSNWTSLTAISLRECQIQGAIPESISNLQSLIVLDLSVNRFDDTEIPSSITKLRNLEVLLLNSCHLTGEIGADLHAFLRTLRHYNLRKNKLKSSVLGFKWFVKGAKKWKERKLAYSAEHPILL